MTEDVNGLRAQILANAKIILDPATHTAPTNTYPGSQSTLLPANATYHGDLDVAIFGEQLNASSGKYTAALMVGLTPAIEGDCAQNPDGALRKLLVATCELLKLYMPKVGAHQRAINCGGVFDEDMISAEIMEAQKKSLSP